MKKHTTKTIFILIGILFINACNKDDRTQQQIDRDDIMALERTLRDNRWGFEDLTVSVQYPTKAIPLLANVADENGDVLPGVYDAYTIFGNSKRQLDYTYQFLRDDINLDTSDGNNFNRVAGYYVIDKSKIRIRPDSVIAVQLNYQYFESNGRIIFQAENVYKEEWVTAINNAIVNSLLSGNPTDLSDKVVDFLQDNEKVQQAIRQFLYDLIHGKIEEITSSPEEQAEKIAVFIVDKLKEIDWEAILYERILERLTEFQLEDPEEIAQQLAQQVSDKIEASISQNDIYEVLLPVFQQLEDEVLPVVVSRVAAAVYDIIAEKLSEENVYERVYPVWQEFTQVDSTTVGETADTLAGIVASHFFNMDSLTSRLIPTIELVDQTPTFQLGGISEEIIDSVLIPKVEQINARFPDLNLDPDWGTIKPIITSFLTVIKSQLGNQTVEELAESLAIQLIGLMDNLIQKGFEKAIYALQEIPPEQVASVFASWVVNLVEMVEEPVVTIIEAKLNQILEAFEAEQAAWEMAGIIHSKILEVFSEQNLYNLFTPIIEILQDLNMERIAETIAQMITEADLLPGEITEEELVAALTVKLSESIGSIDPNNVTEKLVDLLLSSDLVEQIDGDLLKKVIEFKVYELMNSIGAHINAIDNIEFSLIKK